ncbi:MAG: rRNA maturation RNase YbeY [Pseudomonadota bacterium]
MADQADQTGDDDAGDIVICSANGRLSATLRVDDHSWNCAIGPAAVTASVIEALSESRHCPTGEIEFDLAFLTDDDVATLNSQWRGKHGPTNVLSFPSGEAAAIPGPRHLGSVMLAFGVMRKEAAQSKIELADHTTHLILHGVLHLLGHDHMVETERLAMEAAEVELLSGLGIANPYGED